MKNIANTTAELANVQAKNGIITLSYPKVITLFIYTGINPQCIPKITRICQVNPTIAPANSGLKSLIEITICEISVEPNVAIGPITISATGTVINNVSNGTKKNLTKSGTHLLNNFSHLEAKYTINIIGTTVPV